VGGIFIGAKQGQVKGCILSKHINQAIRCKSTIPAKYLIERNPKNLTLEPVSSRLRLILSELGILARRPNIKPIKIIPDIKRIPHIFKRLISWFL